MFRLIKQCLCSLSFHGWEVLKEYENDAVIYRCHNCGMTDRRPWSERR